MNVKYILFLSLLIIINSARKVDDEMKESNSRDEYIYSQRIQKFINKQGYYKKKSIDKEGYQKAFFSAFKQNLNDYRALNRGKEKDDKFYTENLLLQVYNELMQGQGDEIPMNDAFELYDSNKILEAADKYITSLGYPDLVRDITREVLEDDGYSIQKKSKKHPHNDDKIFDL